MVIPYIHISLIRIYNTLCSNHFFLFITRTYKPFQQLQQHIYICNSTGLFLHDPSSLLKPSPSVKTPQSYHSHFTTHTFLSLLLPFWFFYYSNFLIYIHTHTHIHSPSIGFTAWLLNLVPTLFPFCWIGFDQCTTKLFWRVWTILY